MGMVKKFVLLFAVLVLVGGGLWYYRYSKDTYDPSKYSATITSAPANSEGLTEAPAPVLGDGGSTKTAKPAFVGLAKGSKIELTLPDQFEKPHTVSPDVKTLILALSKEAGATARGYLDRQDSEFYPKGKSNIR